MNKWDCNVINMHVVKSIVFYSTCRCLFIHSPWLMIDLDTSMSQCRRLRQFPVCQSIPTPPTCATKNPGGNFRPDTCGYNKGAFFETGWSRFPLEETASTLHQLWFHTHVLGKISQYRLNHPISIPVTIPKPTSRINRNCCDNTR